MPQPPRSWFRDDLCFQGEKRCVLHFQPQGYQRAELACDCQRLPTRILDHLINGADGHPWPRSWTRVNRMPRKGKPCGAQPGPQLAALLSSVLAEPPVRFLTLPRGSFCAYLPHTGPPLSLRQEPCGSEEGLSLSPGGLPVLSADVGALCFPRWTLQHEHQAK